MKYFRRGKSIFEAKLKHKNGHFIPVEISFSIFLDKKKEPKQLVFIRDISGRKRTEQQLRESEERYRNLFENARDAIFTSNLKGTVTTINKVTTEYGFKKDEIVGRNILKYVPKK